jgi:hypothetical protein
MSFSVLGHYPYICLKRLRKPMKNISRDSRSTNCDWKPGLPEVIVLSSTP